MLKSHSNLHMDVTFCLMCLKKVAQELSPHTGFCNSSYNPGLYLLYVIMYIEELDFLMFEFQLKTSFAPFFCIFIINSSILQFKS